MEHIVIVGAGHAGCQVAFGLRRKGFSGEISVISDDPNFPYQRPPLSKDLLLNKKTVDQILLRQPDAYAEANITLLRGIAVTHIDKQAQRLTLSDDSHLSYDKLVLATGSRVRELDVPGGDLLGVHYVKTLADITAIKASLKPNANAVIIGGGYIGLEVAAALRQLAMNVTVIESMERLLQRVTAVTLSEFYQRVHSEEGVNVRTNVQIRAILGHNQVQGVRLSDGSVLDCDVVIVGIGVIPNSELATKAGLATSNGIEVDNFGVTSYPNIYAVGDCTYHFNPIYQRHIRLESVQNANDQGNCVVQTLMGEHKDYSAVPWFWSDQYDLKLQIIGLSQGYDDVIIRGDSHAGRSFSVFYFLDDKLLAVDAVNRPRDFTIGRRLIMKVIDKSIVADVEADLRVLLQ